MTKREIYLKLISDIENLGTDEFVTKKEVLSIIDNYLKPQRASKRFVGIDYVSYEDKQTFITCRISRKKLLANTDNFPRSGSLTVSVDGQRLSVDSKEAVSKHKFIMTYFREQLALSNDPELLTQRDNYLVRYNAKKLAPID